MRFYIASALDNVLAVRELAGILVEDYGWVWAYDWTKHWSVPPESLQRTAEIAEEEIDGVYDADVIIGLLPGGRGTHMELGMGLVTEDCRVVVCGAPDSFYQDGRLCSFYTLAANIVIPSEWVNDVPWLAWEIVCRTRD